MANRLIRKMTFAVVYCVCALALTGCQDTLTSVANKAEHPLPSKIKNKMKAKDMRSRSPIMMRIFKQENVLEVWKQKGNGRFEIIASYEICKWSGKLGPKFKEGDRQAPEGFYMINKHQMNPKSSYYLSFNLGYPNVFDRSHGRTGTHLMVHGACSSAGCYSMSDEQVLQIYGFARDAFRGGQKAFQVQAFPFRMNAENMAKHKNHKDFAFWKNIKVGYDHFELTKRPPKVDVCDRRYKFNQVAENGNKFYPRRACPVSATPPKLTLAYLSHQQNYNSAFAAAALKFDQKKVDAENAAVLKAEAVAKKLAANEAEKKAKKKTPASSLTNPLSGLIVGLNNSPTQKTSTLVQKGQVPVPQKNPRDNSIKKKRPFWKLWSSKND